MPNGPRAGSDLVRPTKPRVRRKKGYHHPDLRRALLDAAILALVDDDVSALTMQRLARRTGVSAAAPYHHFEDLDALLAALATEGWTSWAERAEQAVSAHDVAAARLSAMADAWLTFTRDMPAHYKVMLLPQLGDRVRFAELHHASGRSLALLFGILRQPLSDAGDEDLASRVVLVWSALHGFAMLRAGGVLDNVPAIPPSSVIAPSVLARLVQAVLAP